MTVSSRNFNFLNNRFPLGKQKQFSFAQIGLAELQPLMYISDFIPFWALLPHDEFSSTFFWFQALASKLSMLSETSK